jgi:hypothetical protein
MQFGISIQFDESLSDRDPSFTLNGANMLFICLGGTIFKNLPCCASEKTQGNSQGSQRTMAASIPDKAICRSLGIWTLTNTTVTLSWPCPELSYRQPLRSKNLYK